MKVNLKVGGKYENGFGAVQKIVKGPNASCRWFESELGDHYHEADALTHLGDTHHAAGNFTTARDFWQRALTILTGLNHPDAKTVHAKLALAPEP